MSYFEGLKLTKKGEQLQAKINGNLSETLTFTKAKLGSGSITSNDEIRFLTDVKEEWGTANIASCKIQGEENNIVAIEIQFSNANLRESKIFREIGLYARGNEGEEILYAYTNAGDKYDYIPLMKDSPHSFVIVISFIIASGTKIEANIDLHSYITLQEFNEGMSKKVNKTDYASAEQYGIVKYGAEGGTALEGNKFTQMMGKDYGGVLNEIGLKEAGKAYWDNNTKKLYICKNNNSDISPNINNYIPFDNGSLLERLENLQRYEVLDKSSETNYTSLIFSKIGLIGHVFVDIPAAISKSLREGTLLFTFPDGYRPKSFNLKLIISHFSGQTARTRYDASTGKVYMLSPLNITESMYLDTMYILES